MASKEDEGGCVTLTWEIQNFGLFLSLKAKTLCRTPFWRTEHIEKSVWRRLRIHLTGSDIVVGISRTTECLHLDRCEISLISPCMEVPLKLYGTDSDHWYYNVERDAVFGEKRQSILPNDTLTLRCKMWEKTMKTREFHIFSILRKFSYLWNIEKFHPHVFYSKYIAEENFPFKALLTSKSEKGRHMFILDEVSTIERYVSLIDCKLSDKDGSVRVIKKFRDKYNNVICEIKICLNSTSVHLQLQSIIAVHKNCRDRIKLPTPPRFANVSEEVSGELGDNLLHLYKDKLFSDATLNAEGKVFYVHRNILSARSPVFRTVFQKDEMSEGRSEAVDIDDVDSETVDRMLVYLYGDSLGSVQWKEASALYYAADKYDIQPLKHKCTTVLEESLTVDNACEALVLADRYSDDQLMKSIVDFIRQNEEVITSEKWDSFENNNPLLAAKILRKICVKNRKS